MWQGKVYGSGLATQTDCPPIAYRILQPDRTVENLHLFDQEVDRWAATHELYADLNREGTVTIDLVQRAEFGVDVLGILRSNLDLGVCCSLLAAAPDAKLLGAIGFFFTRPEEGVVALLAVDPRNMPGSPYNTQLRGVGTALVAATAQRMLATGVNVIYLHPLDSEALRFWTARGFQSCGAGSLLCVRGQEAMLSLIDGCLAQPERPADGAYLVCGLPRQVRERLSAQQVPT